MHSKIIFDVTKMIFDGILLLFKKEIKKGYARLP